MKILTKLNLDNLKQNRARTTVTIVGIALSVALILAAIGVVTSLMHAIRIYAIDQYGDFHIMYEDIPGDKLSVIEESSYHTVEFYADHVDLTKLSDDEMELFEYGYPYRRSSYMAITDRNQLIRDSGHQYNVFLKYRDTTKSEHADHMLSRALESAGYTDNLVTRKNGTIAKLDGDMPEQARIFLMSFATLFIGVMAIIAAFVIRNSFNISITERVHQFGMLASVGARPRQIRRMVYQEGSMVGLVAIPLGIIIGSIAAAVIVATINHFVGSLFNSDMLFYIPLSAILLIIIVGVITILLSAASPAIVASRVSPIAALRNTQDIKLRAKKVRTPKLIQRLWGIGGVIAHKNLKRSRQKYHTTVISIVVSVAVFVGVASFMSYGHKAINLFYEDTGANYIIGSGSIGLYRNVVDRFNLKNYGYYLVAAAESGNTYLGGKMPAQIRVVSRDEFVRFAKKTGYNGDDYARQVIFRDYCFSLDSSGSFIYRRGTDRRVGDRLDFTLVRFGGRDNAADATSDNAATDSSSDMVAESEIDRKDVSLFITQVTDQVPIGESSRSYYPDGIAYISEDNPAFVNGQEFFWGYAMYIGDPGIGNNITDYLEHDKSISQYRNDDSYYYSDLEKEMQTIRNVILLSEILVYGFIIVVSLIGVTNIFNTITTNVALRAKEFAVLKSIGMTQAEFNRMIRLESVFYTTRALLIGLPVGMFISYGIYKLFDSAMLGFGWLIPWWAIFTSIVAVALLVASIMRYSTRQIRKQNIIETIRKESF